MESEQLQQLRAAFDAWNRNDWDEALGYMREDVRWTTAQQLPDLDGVYEGREGVRRFFRLFSEPWEEISITLEQIIDERDSQLFVTVRFVAHGREGIEVDMAFFQIYGFDDEKQLAEFQSFVDEAEARGAAGLED